RAWSQTARELDHGVVDLDFEMQDVPPQRARQSVRQIRVLHGRRASIITVEPARNAASATVNGSEPAVSAKYAKSFARRIFGPSRPPRPRLAIGSSPGARLLASPAGLSRSEKNLRRTTVNPQETMSFSTSRARKSN